MDRSTHQVPRLPGGRLNRGRGTRCLGIALHHLLDELDDARPRLRATLPAPEDKHLNCVGWPEARHQGDRRRHLARQLHAL